MKAMEHIFLVLGNGLDWYKGALVDLTPPKLKRMATRVKEYTNEQLWATVWKRLAQVPKATDVARKGTYLRLSAMEGKNLEVPLPGNKDVPRWEAHQLKEMLALTKRYKLLREKHGDALVSDVETEANSVMSQLARPISFYPFSMNPTYGGVGGIPDGVRQDYLQGAIEVLCECLFQEDRIDTPSRNHANAMTVLHRILSTYPGWARLSLPKYGTQYGVVVKVADYHELPEIGREMRYRLESAKSDGHGGYIYDTAALTNEEYFLLRGLDIGGLTKEQQSLVRNYHLYLRWSDHASQIARANMREKVDAEPQIAKRAPTKKGVIRAPRPPRKARAKVS